MFSLVVSSLKGLSTLSLRDMRLKTDMLSIIPMLDSSESITHVDLTGNNMGDAGARSLASLLNHNNVRVGRLCNGNWSIVFCSFVQYIFPISAILPISHCIFRPFLRFPRFFRLCRSCHLMAFVIVMVLVCARFGS